MNLWQRLTSRMQALVKRSDPETVRIFYTGRTNAGEFIDNDQAMRQAVVWACISYLSRTVAQLPWRVLMDTERGTREMRSHAVYRLLAVRPNPEMSPFTFKETMVGWAANWGNAVAELVTNMRGEVTAAWPIHPRDIEFKRDRETGELLYEVTDAFGARTVLRSSQVLHLRGFGDGPVGLNVMAYAAETIGWARATETFGAAYFANGMNPSGVLAMKSKLTPDGKKALEDDLAAKFSGAKRAHKTLVVDFDAEYKRIGIDPQVAQLVETRQTQVEDICRWFGVPPHKVMHLLRSTFSNIEHQSIEVVVDSITPWCLRLEQEADYKLFGANRAGLYTKLDLKGLLRGDYKSRQEGLQIMRRNGVISADEWRALEDMNPLPAGAGGGTYIVEGNMVPLDRVGEKAEPVPSATPSAPVADEPPAGEEAGGLIEDPADAAGDNVIRREALEFWHQLKRNQA